MTLLMSAAKLQQPHMLEQGNGMVNAKTAVDIARFVGLPSWLVSWLVPPVWVLNSGEEVWAGGAVAYGRRTLYGRLVNSTGPRVWGMGGLWRNSLNLSNTAVIEGFITNFRVGNKRLYKHLFNLGLLALVAFTVSQVFYVIVGKTAPLDPIGPQDVGRLLMDGGICALLYFVLNSSTVALAIALASRQSWVTVWTQNFLWTSPANFVNALCALIVFVSFTQGGLPVAAVVVLPAMVIYGAHQISDLRTKQNAALNR
ncbi:MAG: hypothetical protein ACR2L2_02535 [Acidobacteriota bacterium]